MASPMCCAPEIDAVLHRERLRQRQEAAASAADAAGKIARRRDGAGRRGELSDRAGQGAAMVAGGLSREPSAPIKDAMLLTPPSTVRAFSAGYRPVLHGSAECSQCRIDFQRARECRASRMRAASAMREAGRHCGRSAPFDAAPSGDVDRDSRTRAYPSLCRASLAPRAERHQLGFGDVAAHRRHAAIGGRDDVALRHELRDRVDHLDDVLGGLDGVAGDVDHAGLDDLALEQAEQFQRHPRVAAFDRDLLDRAFGDRRKDILILPPLAAERLLPVGIGLDAVAVADVHGGGAGQALRRRAPAP